MDVSANLENGADVAPGAVVYGAMGVPGPLLDHGGLAGVGLVARIFVLVSGSVVVLGGEGGFLTG